MSFASQPQLDRSPLYLLEEPDSHELFYVSVGVDDAGKQDKRSVRIFAGSVDPLLHGSTSHEIALDEVSITRMTVVPHELVAFTIGDETIQVSKRKAFLKSIQAGVKKRRLEAKDVEDYSIDENDSGVTLTPRNSSAL